MNGMQTTTVALANLSCGHCKKTIESELRELGGVRAVEVDVAARTATIAWEPPADWDAIESLLAEIGYPPAA